MRSKVKPLSAQSFGVQFTLSQSEHDLVCYAQDLLPGDVREVFVRALRAHVRQLEQGKFAATEKPRAACPRPTRSARRIPAHVRRAVWERDGGQCTFVSNTGHRCKARRGIQFDHIDPVARGGEATVSGIRLLCPAHNQHAAEQAFGAEFMRRKRVAAADREAVAEARMVVPAHTATRAQDASIEPASMGTAIVVQASGDVEDRDVVPWLRALGFSVAEARRAAARCEGFPEASLEERVRFALSCIGVRGTRIAPFGAGQTRGPLQTPDASRMGRGLNS